LRDYNENIQKGDLLMRQRLEKELFKESEGHGVEFELFYTAIRFPVDIGSAKSIEFQRII
jgi:hypothetical protein